MLRGAVISLALAVLAGPGTAQGVALAPEQVQQAAAAAYGDGRWAEARALAVALLQRDPTDPVAALILARSAFELGDMATTREAAARLYRSDLPAPRRYEAARLAALAAANEGRITAAQWWLRRALIQAQTPEEVAQTNRDAAALRDLTPWRTDIDLSFAPSDNVNGGADSEFNFIDGLPFVGLLTPDAQALSGWVGTASVNVGYRLAEDAVARTTLSLRLWGRAVTLSQEARDFLDAETRPGDDPIRARDFSSALVQGGLRHDRVIGGVLYGVGADFGTTWAGGERNYDFARLSVDQTIAFSDADRLSLSAFGEERYYVDSLGLTETRFGLQAGWSRALNTGALLRASVGWRMAESENLNANSESWSVEFGYAPGQQIGPAWVNAALGAQWTDYPDYFVGFFPVPGGRQDTRVYGRAEAVLSDWSYAGFAPVVTLDVERTTSNVSRFETEGINLGVGLRSTF